MNILVTGGAGYIGSHACKALAEAGYMPVVYDNFSTGHRAAVQWGPAVEGDVRDGTALRAAMEAHGIQAVMHFAANSLVGESVSDPAAYYDNNVTGMLALLACMREASVETIVFSSSCAVYGQPDTPLIAETNPRNPLSPYGKTKLACEFMLEDFSTAYGMRYAALRYFNAAGADASARIGEDHTPETHLIPLVLDAALGRRPEITLHGTDYPTPDGSCIRDYIHVTDLAAAHVAALAALLETPQSLVLNLGTGKGVSVREVIAAAARVTGRAIPVAHGPRRAGDPAMLVSAPGRAMNLLDWQPAHSTIETILEDAWRWHQQRFS